jgi:transcriptional regulator with XRE-family HTH domain
MAYNNIELAELIKERMSELGINQSELAERSKLSPSQISRIIKLESIPSHTAIVAIARALRLPTENLFQAAGILDSEPDPKLDVKLKEWIDIYKTANKATREKLLEFAKMVARVEEENQGKQDNK